MAMELRKRREEVVPVSFSGFPVRSLTRNVEGRVSGEWVMAYQMQQKRRFRLSVGSAIASLSSVDGPHTSMTTPENTMSTTSTHRHNQCILTATQLLKRGYVYTPSDLCVIDISGQGLTQFREKGLEEFDNLACVVASDNHLPLEGFLSFPALQELELSLNGISNIELRRDSFPRLTTLDLSYNALSNDAIIALGRLPRVVELRLSGNNLVSLPNDMSRPYKGQSADGMGSDIRVSFPTLERLWVDDNKLSDPTTFAILAGLRSLQYLCLDNNELVTVPHLKLLGAGLLKGDQPLPPPGDAGAERTREAHSSASLAPFPQLQSISLRNNMILDATSILPCSTWPLLRELIVIGNPMVTMQRGLPLAVEEELVHRSNISVIRHPLPQGNKSTNYRQISTQFRKVSLTPPPLIPKQPLVLAIEPSLSHGGRGHQAVSSNQSYDSEEEEGSGEASTEYSHRRHSEGRVAAGNKQQQPAGVFLTEFNQGLLEEEEPEGQRPLPNSPLDDPSLPSPPAEKDLSVKDLFLLRRNKERGKYSGVPDKFKGFESLLDDEEDDMDDAPPLPTDQHSCRQVLKYTLDHPLLAKGYRKQPRPLEPAEPGVGQYLKRKPTTGQYHNTPAVSSRKVKVSGLLEDLKEHQDATEANLQEILVQQELVKTFISGRRSKSEQAPPPQMTETEGKQLLLELEAKYKKVRELSLATLAVIDSATHIAKTASQP